MTRVDGIVRKGCAPWLPQPEATGLDVWHADDVPRLGTFELGDTRVLFTAVGEVSAGLTVWAYLPLTDAQWDRMEDEVFETVVDMQRSAEREFECRHAVFATSRDFKLTRWSTEPVGQGATAFLKAVIAFLDQVRVLVEGQVEDSRRRQSSPTQLRAFGNARAAIAAAAAAATAATNARTRDEAKRQLAVQERELTTLG
ncbi:hypothetical protein ACFWE5_03780 [Cellulosimicrobium funkei]|uniref:hypothetical protein n=1 Tax=Cellulosimicrobium funkei TaxID=264251 RepID=UPI0036655413